jgi:hypothetical protein
MLDDRGLIYIAMQRLWIRIARHDYAGAIGGLSTLTSHRFFKQSTWFQSLVHAFCVQSYAAVPDRSGAEEALVAYERLRRRQSSAWRDLQVYKTVARLRAQDGDLVRAELAFRRAIEAIDELAHSWPDADDLRWFLERQSAFLGDVRQFYGDLNRAGEAERLIAPVASVETIEQRLVDDRRHRDRRLARAGRWMLFIDFCCTIGLTLSPAFGKLAPRNPIAVGGVMFVLGTIEAVVFFVLYWVIGLIMPRLRSGLVTLLFACVPWLSLLASLISTAF